MREAGRISPLIGLKKSSLGPSADKDNPAGHWRQPTVRSEVRRGSRSCKLKPMRDVLKSRSTPSTAKLLLCLTCALLGILLHRWSYVRAFEWKTYDLRVQWMAAREEPSRDIVIIALDNQSLSRLEPAVGRWPWPRAIFAGLLDYCSGAVTVGMDILLTEADWQYRPSDDVLAEEASRYGALASAIHFDHRSEPPADVHEISEHALPAIHPSDLHVPAYTHFTAPYPSLLDATARLGHVNYMPDEDGVVRSYMVLAEACGRVYPSLAVALVMLRDHLSPADVRVVPGGLRHCREPRRLLGSLHPCMPGGLQKPIRSLAQSCLLPQARFARALVRVALLSQV